MKRALRLALASTALAVCANLQAAPTFINILTGGTSGVYYPIGVGISQIYGHGIEGSKVSVQATKASVENLNLLQAGRGELAFALGDSVADAWKGDTEAGFKTPLKKLRAIAGTYPNYIQLVASKESGIRSLDDLKGKRISVGAPKSGTELNARAIFKAAGLTYQDMGKVEYLPYAESVELIKNRQLDATLQSSGLGQAAIRDLAATLPVVFVPIPAQVVAKIGNDAYQQATIPAGTYDGQEAEVPTAAIINVLVTRQDVSDELAYQMTRLLFDNLPRLVNAHAAAKDIRAENAAKHLPYPCTQRRAVLQGKPVAALNTLPSPAGGSDERNRPRPAGRYRSMADLAVRRGLVLLHIPDRHGGFSVDIDTGLAGGACGVPVVGGVPELWRPRSSQALAAIGLGDRPGGHGHGGVSMVFRRGVDPALR